MSNLHPFQVSVIGKLRYRIRSGARSILLVSPTGSGKTRMVSEALRLSGMSCLALAHRVELCKQISKEFARTGPERHKVLGVTSAGVGAYIKQAAYRALFVDEGHHLPAASYRRLVENRGNMLLIAATATPYRSDGVSLSKYFDSVVTAPSASELTESGHLADVSYVSSGDVDYDGIKLTKRLEFEEEDALRRVRVAVQAGDLVAAWAKYARGKNALIYTVNIEHAERVKAELDASKVPAAIITGRTSRKERAQHIAAFERQTLRALVNCEVFTEGTDIKMVGAIIMLRPTNSRTLYKQMIGRGMRPDVSCVVIDHVGNFLRHGNVMTEDSLQVMSAARLLDAGGGGVHSQSSGPAAMRVDFQRMDLHVEKVECSLVKIWTPSVFAPGASVAR